MDDLKRIDIAGQIEPWSAGLESEISVRLDSKGVKCELGDALHPDQMGAFVLTLHVTPEIRKLLDSGGLEVQAVSEDKVIGRQSLRGAGKHSSIAVLLPVTLGGLLRIFQPSRPRSFEVIPARAVRSLAQRVASIQRVNVFGAKAPKTVLSAIRELNGIAQLAARVRAGDQAAAKDFRQTLGASAVRSPGGAPRGFSGALGARMAGAIADALPGRGCGGTLAEARDIVETGFLLDLRDGNRNPVWTGQARAYVRDRMRAVGSYFGSVDRALAEPGPGGDFPGGGPGLPPGGDGSTDPILPPGEDPGLPPGGDIPEPPDDVGGLGSDLCEMIADICIGQFEATIAASLLDEYVDLIGSVDEPNCLCFGTLLNNPNQEFTGRPAAGRIFPQAPLLNVKLFFTSRVSTVELNPTFWSAQEIRFRLPVDSRTGFVYLRALAKRPSQESQELARVCGTIFPGIPHEILVDRAPAAQVSIVYPPVISSVTAGNLTAPPFEFEACTDVALCWEAHLQGEPGVPLPPCGAVQVAVRDATGQPAGEGGATGCVSVNRMDDQTYTLEATSLANGAACGGSNQQTITITRFRAVRLDWNQPQPNAGNPVGTPILGGTEGSITVHVSCAAGAGGIIVNLSSDNMQALQVDSPVTIPQGQTSAQTRIVAAAQCQSATITATAAGHRPIGSLMFDVHVQPVLAFVGNAPDLRLGDTATVEIDAVCVPDHPDVEWWQVQADGAGQPVPNGQQIRLTQPTLASAQRFAVALQGAALGSWSLLVQIPFRGGIQSAGLAFAVAAQPSFALTVVPMTREVVWGQGAAYDVQVQGSGLTAQPLDVSLAVGNLPVGASGELRNAQGQVSAIVSLTQQAALQSRALNISTVHAATVLGSSVFRVTGTSTGLSPVRQNPNLVVRRSTGAFARASVIRPRAQQATTPPFSQSCGNQARAEAEFLAVNDLRITFFSSVTGTEESTGAIPGVYLVFSPHCRVGVVMATVTGSFPVSWYNLGFPAAPVSIAQQVTQLNSVLWRQFWFSSDDSLLLIIEDDVSGNPPVTHDFTATVYDCTRNHQFARESFAASYEVVSGGPEGLGVPMPLQTMTIVLEPSGDRVTMTFEVDLMGNTDTLALILR